MVFGKRAGYQDARRRAFIAPGEIEIGAAIASAAKIADADLTNADATRPRGDDMAGFMVRGAALVFAHLPYPMAISAFATRFRTCSRSRG